MNDRSEFTTLNPESVHDIFGGSVESGSKWGNSLLKRYSLKVEQSGAAAVRVS
ncbi:hypothetical protein PCCS19_31880 [Paenibacillus sp. CCS19]|nr:hypothetical protein PCCS19_31880 [Paenibacillus cellulosilyticus]